jgi:hypothetical protein
MSAVAQPWLISKYGFLFPYTGCTLYLFRFADITALRRFCDPLFAMCVGISAAALRIHREEKEKYPKENNDYRALWAKGMHMGKGYLGGYQHRK